MMVTGGLLAATPTPTVPAAPPGADGNARRIDARVGIPECSVMKAVDRAIDVYSGPRQRRASRDPTAGQCIPVTTLDEIDGEVEHWLHAACEHNGG